MFIPILKIFNVIISIFKIKLTRLYLVSAQINALGIFTELVLSLDQAQLNYEHMHAFNIYVCTLTKN